MKSAFSSKPEPHTDGATWQISWTPPVVSRRGKVSCQTVMGSSSERLERVVYLMWAAVIDKEIEASDLDDDFAVDEWVAFQR